MKKLSLFVTLLLMVLFLLLPLNVNGNTNRELLFEHALLMSLNHEIKTALRKEIKVERVQFDCDKITNIELITLPSGSQFLSEGHAFIIEVQLRAMVNDKWKLVNIAFDNNNATASYTARKVQIEPLPKNFICPKKLYP
jgi:hypothetical protein